MRWGKETHDTQFLSDHLVGEAIKDIWVETAMKFHAKLRNLNFIP